MRIICPNCDAQYEVEDRMIPDTGRDVQCSNCGHGWYQYPPGADPEDEDEDDAEAGLPPPPPAPPAAARPLDDSLRAILREEAEREAAARAAEAQARRRPETVEFQPDLGLPSVVSRPAAPPRTAPAADPAAVEPPAPPAPAAAARRERLPDIETINSSLSAGKPDTPQPPAPEPRGGFVQGFAAVFLVVAVLYGLYVFAPRLAAAVPAAGGALNAYVSAVDAAHRAVSAAIRPAPGG